MLIAQLSDLHVCEAGRLANGVVDTNVLAARAFAAVREAPNRPDLILLSGDLVEAGRPEQYRNLAGMVQDLPAPVFAIPGNHDARDALRAELGGMVPTQDAPFIQYVIEDQPVRLVMLDTLVPGSDHGELCDQRLRFLETALAAAPDRPTMVAMHHPPLTLGIGHMDRIALRNPGQFAAVIARHPQVRRIVCGHVHRPAFGSCAHAIVAVAPSVAHQVELNLNPGAPGAFTFEPGGYYLHRWTPADGLVTHLAFAGEYKGPYIFGVVP